MKNTNTIFKTVHMRNYTRIKIGGLAKMARVDSIDELINLLKIIKPEQEYNIIGAGSNIICNSNKIDSLIIKLGKNFNFIKQINKTQLKVGGTTLGITLAKKSLELEITGMEFMIGIPGTIGGICAMNAGAYGKEICELIESITFIDRNGNLIVKKRNQIKFSYRRCHFPDDWIIIECTLNTTKGDKAIISKNLNNIVNSRKKTQPVNQLTCGSTFINTLNYPAWKVIKQTGMDKIIIGDIMFSDLHCNFLINRANATSEDALFLIKETQKKAKKILGIDLKLEIRMIGM